jgi:2-polyprenyl-6-methoxyphenol hydroxylase-like FAD-dependent oxidoreductase
MTPADGRVVVIGAGMGGLAATLALRRIGLTVDIYERAPELHPVGAGIGVQGNAFRALRRLGLEARLREVAVPLETFEFRHWNGRVLASWSQGQVDRELGSLSVNLHRSELHDLLYGAVGSETVHLGMEYVGFDQDDTGVTVRFADGSEQRARVLVAADGSQSRTRKELQPDRELRYAGFVAWRGVTKHSDSTMPVGTVRQFLGRGRSFGEWHLGEGRIYWVATRKMAEGAGDGPAGRKADVLETVHGLFPPAIEVVRPLANEQIVRNDIYDSKPTPGWTRGRVALLGDAAHPSAPTLGQAGGQAMIDGVALAKSLAIVSDLDDPKQVGDALEVYELSRYESTADFVNEAHHLGRLTHLESPAACLARDVFMRTTPQRVWRERMVTRLSYRE